MPKRLRDVKQLCSTPIQINPCTHLQSGLLVDVLTHVLTERNDVSACDECGQTTGSLWLCGTCGFIGCGRFSNKHGIHHRRDFRVSVKTTLRRSKRGGGGGGGGVTNTAMDEDQNTDDEDALPVKGSPGDLGAHAVAIDLSDGKVWCHACTDWVLEDDLQSERGELDRLRKLLATVVTLKKDAPVSQPQQLQQLPKRRSRSASLLLTDKANSTRNLMLVKAHGGSSHVLSEQDRVDNAHFFYLSGLLRRTFNGLRKNATLKKGSLNATVTTTLTTFSSTAALHEPPHATTLQRNTTISAATPSKKAVRKMIVLPGRSGMRNLGNTCYINAVVQCLGHLRDIRSFFVSVFATYSYPEQLTLEVMSRESKQALLAKLRTEQGQQSQQGRQGSRASTRNTQSLRNSSLIAAAAAHSFGAPPPLDLGPSLTRSSRSKTASTATAVILESSTDTLTSSLEHVSHDMNRSTSPIRFVPLFSSIEQGASSIDLTSAATAEAPSVLARALRIRGEASASGTTPKASEVDRVEIKSPKSSEIERKLSLPPSVVAADAEFHRSTLMERLESEQNVFALQKPAMLMRQSTVQVHTDMERHSSLASTPGMSPSPPNASPLADDESMSVSLFSSSQTSQRTKDSGKAPLLSSSLKANHHLLLPPPPPPPLLIPSASRPPFPLRTDGRVSRRVGVDPHSSSPLPVVSSSSSLLAVPPTQVTHDAQVEDSTGWQRSSLSVQVSNCLRILWSGQWSSFTPAALVSTIKSVMPQFMSYQQQDAHEFITNLIDALQEELILGGLKRGGGGGEGTSSDTIDSGSEIGVSSFDAVKGSGNGLSGSDGSDAVSESLQSSIIMPSQSFSVSGIVQGDREEAAKSAATRHASPLLRAMGSDLVNALPRFPQSGIMGLTLAATMRTETTCKMCHRVSAKNEPHNVISLELEPSSFSMVALTGDSSARTSTGQKLDGHMSRLVPTTLFECLARVCRTEEMSGETAYACEKCKKKVPATRQQLLHILPPAICFHVNRAFINTGSLSGHVPLNRRIVRFKFQNYVECPSTLSASQLWPYLSADAKKRYPQSSGVLYKLTGIVEHRGRSIDSGHYLAHCLDPNDEEAWVVYDDNVVRVESEDDVQKAQVYLAFYERV